MNCSQSYLVKSVVENITTKQSWMNMSYSYLIWGIYPWGIILSDIGLYMMQRKSIWDWNIFRYNCNVTQG